MAFIFPTHIFNPRTIKPTRARRIITGGQPISGAAEDVIEIDGGGFWLWSFGEIHLRTTHLLRAWDAWDNYLAGGTVEFWLPVASIATAPLPTLIRTPGIATDADIFPTAAAFAIPLVRASVVGARTLRDTTITINVSQGRRLEGGEKFSIAHSDGPGLYSVTRVTAQSGQVSTVKIWPPLRAAVANAETVNFDWPLMRARLAPGYDMSPQVMNGRHATAEVQFVESTN